MRRREPVLALCRKLIAAGHDSSNYTRRGSRTGGLVPGTRRRSAADERW